MHTSKLEKGFIQILKKYSNYELDFWDPNKYDWKYSWALAEYCSEHFEIWWDPNKFNWKFVDYLKKYCQDYKHIWGPHAYLKT